MQKLLFITFALLILCGCSSRPQIVKDAISVNGLQIGEKYTPQQLIAALGTPDKIISPQDETEFPNARTYKYTGETGVFDTFSTDNGVFYSCILKNSKFVINNHIRVGDRISKIDDLEGVKQLGQTDGLQYIDWRPSKEGLYNCTSVTFYYNSRQIITRIDVMIFDM